MKLNYLQKAENFESQAGACHVAMVWSQGHCLFPASVEHLFSCPQVGVESCPLYQEMQRQKQRETKAVGKVHMATSALTQVLRPETNVEV